MRALALASLPVLLLACGGGGPGPGGDGGVGCFAGQQTFGEVCLTKPTLPAARTQCGDVTEYCDTSGTTKPSLGCLGGAPKPHPPTPAKVTLTGFVHPFSSGNKNTPVTIQIFRASDLVGGADPSTVQQVVPATTVTFDAAAATDPAQFRACDTDSKIGCVAIAPSACQAPTCNDGLSGRPDDKKYCRSVAGVPECRDRLRWEARFSIKDVPTNTSLVIRSNGANGQSDTTWATLVAWNVFLASDDKPCADAHSTDCLDLSNLAEPKYQLNVSVLSQADYGNIPVVAGLAGGIGDGQGAVAGEVHDCDNIRVGNAQVGVKPAGDRQTYFNGNPYMTLPDSGRATLGTDRLGLYAALNVSPGRAAPWSRVSVEAASLVDGQLVSVGKFAAVVYPNSVAVLNLNGGKPPQ